jgi:hypothetical protein
MDLNSARTIRRLPDLPRCPVLAERYLRLYTHIARAWGSPALPGLLRDLIVVDRPLRRGFPVAVMRELLALVHAARHEPRYQEAFEWFEVLQQEALDDAACAMTLNAADPHTVLPYLLASPGGFASRSAGRAAECRP